MTRRRTRRAFVARPLESLEARSLLSTFAVTSDGTSIAAGESSVVEIMGSGLTGQVGPHRGPDRGPTPGDREPRGNTHEHRDEETGPEPEPDGEDCGCSDSHGADRLQLEADARAEAEAYIAHQHHHGAHPDDPVMREEHHAFLNLMPFESATAIAILDGDWTDPETWLGCEVPGPGARVWIMPGRTVSVDAELADPAAAVRVSGTLRFHTDRDTRLVVETLLVNPDGRFEMGTEADPIAPEVTARVVFAGAGPINPATDPTQLGRGLVSHGAATIHGAEVTSWLALARPARAGERSLELTATPVGWKAGDTLALAGAELGQDERLTIASITGRTVYLTTPLKYAHAAPTAQELAARHGQAPPGAPLEIHVANLTRNARFESANPGQVQTRGHVMFMHSPEVEVAYAGFYGLGRTDKSRPIQGDNVRGRYALHVHRTGSASAATPVHGVAVDGSPGWGIANHSSHVDVTSSVVYNAVGAAFVAEAGDEHGSFRDNLAIRAPGSPNDPPDNIIARRNINDYGFSGHGFWLQSPTVAMTGNIVSGAAGLAISYYHVYYEGPSIGIDHLAIAENRDNTMYAGRRGLRISNSKPADGPHRVEGLTAWGLRYDGFIATYATHVELVGARLITRHRDIHAVNVDKGRDFTFQDNYIVGYRLGLEAGYGGRNAITGGYLNNTTDLLITKNTSAENVRGGVREVEIRGVEFAGGGIQMVGGLASSEPLVTGRPNEASWTQFAPERITWDGQRLYYAEQAAGVVLRSPVAAYNNKTNAQLMASHGLAYAGAVMPGNAVAVAGLRGGRVGPAQPVGPVPLLWVATYIKPHGRVNVVLRDGETGAALLVNLPAKDIRPGWNVLWATMAGVRRPAFWYVP